MLRTHNDANELTEIDSASTHVATSAHGNMSKVPVPGDEANHHYACTYDAWNRLVKVKDDASNTVAEYRYDGLGRRIRKFTPDGDDWLVREFYYNNAWQLLEVRKDTGKTRTGDPLTEPSLAATLHKQFVWSIRYIDAPVLRDRDGDDDGETGDLAGLEERLYYMTDANMNVTALVQGTPGDGDLGKVVERYMYDPYGKVTALHGDADADDPVTEWDADSTPDWDNHVLFCGYWRDGDTGLDCVRHRWYHPTLGRWPTRDPLGYIDGMSLYEYCRSRPVGYADPLGSWIGDDDSYGHPSKSKDDLKEEMRQIMRDIATEEGKQCPNDVDWLKLGRKLASKINKNRYVWTKKGGWIDLKHFIRAAIEANRFWVSHGLVIDRGRVIERDQARQGNKSAYGVEDLPSNRYGVEFEPEIDNSNMESLPDKIVDYIENELGGFGDPPLDKREEFNKIRNLGEKPVLDPNGSDIKTDEETGIRYMPSSHPLNDANRLEWLKQGGITGDNPGTSGGGREVPSARQSNEGGGSTRDNIKSTDSDRADADG